MPWYVRVKNLHKTSGFVSKQDQLCLTALLYDHEVAALKTCAREVTELPVLPTALYLGNSIYRLCAADEQQFLYNIRYSDGKEFSSRVNGCKSCLVQPTCNRKLLHPNNVLVMLPDPGECVGPTGSINTISTPEVLYPVFTIPSAPTNLPTNEQQTLTLPRVRAELQCVNAGGNTSTD